jgi:hypothetical protein
MVVGTWYLEQVISHWLKDLALFVVTGGGGTRYTQEMGICALELFLLANTQICSKHN